MPYNKLLYDTKDNDITCSLCIIIDIAKRIIDMISITVHYYRIKYVLALTKSFTSHETCKCITPDVILLMNIIKMYKDVQRREKTRFVAHNISGGDFL